MLKALQKLRFKGKKDKKLAESLHLILGFYPKNLAVYEQALRHSSASKEIIKGARNSNERLEYLGDAVLGAIIAEYLFKLYPFKDEGFLTQMRSRIVNRANLNHISSKLGLDVLIIADLKGSKATSINGDALEAFIGATYLDLGYKKTQKFILEKIIHNLLDITEIEQTDSDYKSKLINLCQKNKQKLLFNLVGEKGKGNQKEFIIQTEIDGKSFVEFQHKSKKRAEQLAAQLTLEMLEKNQ